MYLTARHRRIGRWSALLAVYAFVLNALLATTLMAATSASKSLSGFELCAAADGVSVAGHDDRTIKRAAIHCQLCLAHAAAPALPPPSQALLPQRMAVAVVLHPPFPAIAPEPHRSPNHRPRGPPH